LCLNIFNENPEHINLKVMGQDGNVVQFKIKRHTALKKLMSTYCERAGLALQTIRFSFNGTRINESDTPKGLDMEDGDTIEVLQQQSGGGSSQVTATQGGGGRVVSSFLLLRGEPGSRLTTVFAVFERSVYLLWSLNGIN
jgi:small ubiquitin-related modifier